VSQTNKQTSHLAVKLSRMPQKAISLRPRGFGTMKKSATGKKFRKNMITVSLAISLHWISDFRSKMMKM
jgi:hypothetical protein